MHFFFLLSWSFSVLALSFSFFFFNVFLIDFPWPTHIGPYEEYWFVFIGFVSCFSTVIKNFQLYCVKINKKIIYKYLKYMNLYFDILKIIYPVFSFDQYNHLLTVTYRNNYENRERNRDVERDWGRLIYTFDTLSHLVWVVPSDYFKFSLSKFLYNRAGNSKVSKWHRNKTLLKSKGSFAQQKFPVSFV